MCGTAEEPESKSHFPSKLWFSAKLAGSWSPDSPAATGKESDGRMAYDSISLEAQERPTGEDPILRGAP